MESLPVFPTNIKQAWNLIIDKLELFAGTSVTKKKIHVIDTRSSLFRSRKSKPAKEKLSKQDISGPSNMIHVYGIKGSASGFEMVNNSNQVPML